jgi:hypothetical protein
VDVNHYTAAALSIYLDAFESIAALGESDAGALEETKKIIRQADLDVLPYIPDSYHWLDARVARAREVALYYLSPQKPPTAKIAVRVARETLAELKSTISEKELYSGRRFLQFAEASQKYALERVAAHISTDVVVEIAEKAWSQLESAEDAFAAHPDLPPDEGTFRALFAEAGHPLLRHVEKTQEPESPEF